MFHSASLSSQFNLDLTTRILVSFWCLKAESIKIIMNLQKLLFSCSYLDNFIFLRKELNCGAKFNWIPSIDLWTIQNLDTTVALAAGEWYGHGEEVVWVSSAGELHGSSLVVPVNDGVLPQKLLFPRVMGVVTLALGYVGGPAPVGQGDGDGHVVQLQVQVLQLKLDVDVAASGSIVWGPAVDGQRDAGLIGGLQPPFEDTDPGV